VKRRDPLNPKDLPLCAIIWEATAWLDYDADMVTGKWKKRGYSSTT